MKKIPLVKTLTSQFALTKSQKEFIETSRKTIQNILQKKDNRLLVIVGPCSIHSQEEALDYAQKIVDIQKTISDKIFLVMRVYIEKPRTTLGWRGYVYDPLLNGSNDISLGLQKSVELCKQITELSVPIATELLTPAIVPFIENYISWASIGARTVESQIHRELASSLPFSVGFKNSTSGNIQVAVNAVKTASHSHAYIGISQNNELVQTQTQKNICPHIVLRGGITPNYDEYSIQSAYELLQKEHVANEIIIDCSHANSKKIYDNQTEIFMEVLSVINNTTAPVCGMMLESNLYAGSQSIPPQKRGISITDPCLGWDETKKLLLQAYDLYTK